MYSNGKLNQFYFFIIYTVLVVLKYHGTRIHIIQIHVNLIEDVLIMPRIWTLSAVETALHFRRYVYTSIPDYRYHKILRLINERLNIFRTFPRSTFVGLGRWTISVKVACPVSIYPIYVL